ncbi:PTS beta-glucoside transporter subunit EIIBCA [Boudabousia liubingyangii]|uniref:glucose PTS transporter subunit IIA n=1 Tax=Boudabousia liubingyangii TaxID=1921764 RepID=UPI00093A209B|nr:glucose PTS transporter subunit IIA [Boudabousia liubingyangii]OKL46309.1 PTS beta-glucoside transporter subunit EIIBCA [Boudabousia liubingyangii]
MTTLQSEILRLVGGVENVKFLTHCATRLRFTLNDTSKADVDALDALDGVLGVVPQGNTGVQVVIGGGVAAVYDDIMHEPGMAGRGDADGDDDDSDGTSDADVKAAIRAKAKGKNAWVDAFFEYLSDSFRPLLGVLLGASMFITIAAVLDAFGVYNFRDPNKGASWVFLDAMWRSVFYFLPIMVAYNAAKKLRLDPWVGAAVMAAVMTPDFIALGSRATTTCVMNEALQQKQCTAHIFQLPMQLNDYGGQVFVPLIMVAILAIFYRLFQKLIPSSVHMVFVPFLSMLVMIPMTAYLIGPMGIWLGNGIGLGLAWLNSNAPIVFAIIIPLLYPFLVPLGLHWPLNALMLLNIQTLGYDFIQGPMGAWNFACFGATAGVLYISMREKDTAMRQVSFGALAAGLLGGISEPSLYGIHLRYKRIYPRMLVGCFAGGLIVGLGGGIKASAFVFTSIFTFPVFSPTYLYLIAIAVAFFTSMFLVIISDYRTPEQREEAAAKRAKAEAKQAAKHGQAVAAPVTGAATSSATATATKTAPVKTALLPDAVTFLDAPLQGRALELSEIPDPVFAGGKMGKGVGVDPTGNEVVAPADGKILIIPDSGHAVGMRCDNGLEILVHVGIDTVAMNGDGFEVLAAKGDQVFAGQPLIRFDRSKIEAAGYSPITAVLITNSKKFAEVDGPMADAAALGAPLIRVTAKPAKTEG